MIHYTQSIEAIKAILKEHGQVKEPLATKPSNKKKSDALNGNPLFSHEKRK